MMPLHPIGGSRIPYPPEDNRRRWRSGALLVILAALLSALLSALGTVAVYADTWITWTAGQPIAAGMIACVAVTFGAFGVCAECVRIVRIVRSVRCTPFPFHPDPAPPYGGGKRRPRVR